MLRHPPPALRWQRRRPVLAPPGPTPYREVPVALRIIIGLALTAAAFAIAGRRVWWVYRLPPSGDEAPPRVQALREHPAGGAQAQVIEVFGQRKLLQWSVPGVAHFLTFWGFIILI